MPKIMWEINREVCHNCGACVGVCPVNVLRLNWDRIECAKGCIGCKSCERVCPVGAIKVTAEKEERGEKNA